MEQWFLLDIKIKEPLQTYSFLKSLSLIYYNRNSIGIIWYLAYKAILLDIIQFSRDGSCSATYQSVRGFDLIELLLLKALIP